jgi:hypothetical protein
LFDHHVADLNDLRLHYVTAGNGEPVLLQPGFYLGTFLATKRAAG